jgi:hypothetical protein
LIINPLASPVLQSGKSIDEINISKLDESRNININNSSSFNNISIDNSSLNEVLAQICSTYDEELEELINYEKMIYNIKNYKEDNNESNPYKKSGSFLIEKHRQNPSSDLDEGYKSGNSAMSDKTYLFSNINSDNSLIKFNSKKGFPILNSVTIDLLSGGQSKNKIKIDGNTRNNNLAKSKKLK